MNKLEKLYHEHVGKVSDKWQLYLREYERLFAPYQDAPVRLLEIGVQNGGSLAIWHQYFANAQNLVGCDINVNCSKLEYDDRKISVIVGDANAIATQKCVLSICDHYDVIIDDGSHTSKDIIQSFCLYFPFLTEGGLFVAEDLHCSYWEEFDGGLYDPYSSMSFFKHLTDIINHEHWGIEKSHEDLLAGFCKKYNITLDARQLESIHSVEFINSMCVIRKAEPENNTLGLRVIAGSEEVVLPGHLALQGSAQAIPSQAQNKWTAREFYPMEEIERKDIALANLNEELGKRDEVIADLHNEVIKRDLEILERSATISDYGTQITAYHEATLLHLAMIQERDEILQGIYSSKSWLLTRPLRSLVQAGRNLRVSAAKMHPDNLRRYWRLAKPHVRAAFATPGAFRAKAGLLFRILRTGGYSELISRLKRGETSVAADPLPGDLTMLQFMDDFISPAAAIKLDPLVKVVVIIPVYRGLDETARCIESVLNSTNKIDYSLLLINDASPESEMQGLLTSYADKHDNVSVLKNDANLGFVRTVNRGMHAADDADIVLLNSDTVVAGDWLDRLAAHAQGAELVGTVTPFSNNATICNYPDLDGWASLPDDESVHDLHHAFAEANSGKAIDIPTAVGFCMYIKRQCLSDVGVFDAETFGKGYGEENDFCLRATSKGWKHLLAADAFVFHEGEVSFSASAAHSKDNAMNIIRNKYPDYENIIYSHIIQNAAYPYRVFATAARYRLGNKPVMLFITHTLGGGTERHVQELAATISAQGVRILVLRPAGDSGEVTLESYDKWDKLKLQLCSHDVALLAAVLDKFGVSKIHVHHTLGLQLSIESLAAHMGIPYDYTVHDFYSICPRINLLIPKKGYCGAPSPDVCNNCLQIEPKKPDIEVTWWRAQSGSLLNGADSVYCPSDDTARRMAAHFPGARLKVVEHEELVFRDHINVTTALRSNRRVALLGVLTEHKGLDLIKKALAIIKRDNVPLEFILIGYCQPSLAKHVSFTQTGPYNDEDLLDLIERMDPTAILIPAQWPETYSYTLSAALLSGRPVAVSDIGALPERVAGLGRGFVFPHDISGSGLVRFLMELPAGQEIEKSRVACSVDAIEN